MIIAFATKAGLATTSFLLVAAVVPSDAVILAAFAMITAITTSIIGLLTARGVRQKVEAVQKATIAVKETTDSIVKKVDGHQTDLTNRLDTSDLKIAFLTEQLATAVAALIESEKGKARAQGALSEAQKAPALALPGAATITAVPVSIVEQKIPVPVIEQGKPQP